MSKFRDIEVAVVLLVAIAFFSPSAAIGGGLDCDSVIQKPLQLAAITAHRDDDPTASAQNFVCPEQHGECRTNLCKDANGRYLCCPSDNPYLNHCNCLCYESFEAATADAQCPKYTVCK